MTILEVVLGIISVVLLAIVIFSKSFISALAKKIAEISTAKQLTRIEEVVKHEFRKNIESLKAELQKKNDRYKIQYEYLHISRSKAIKKLYDNLVTLHYTFNDFMSPYQLYFEEDTDQEHRERGVKAARALTSFIKFFLHNRIYFDKSFCSTIDNFIKKYNRLIVEFVQNERNIELYRNSTPNHIRVFYDKIDVIYNDIEKILPVEIEKLENQLRGYIILDDVQ